ncbi:MAG: hypothetical protein GX649_10840 [Chloroflexi bacterium]|nr:hypothetical protein [Chloroflexota bacterium]
MERVLVAYVTHSGSTQGVAECMRDEFTALGYQAEACAATEVTDVSSYDAVVAGGLLYRFGWHPDVMHFLKKHESALRDRRVALFMTGLRIFRTPFCDEIPCPTFTDPNILRQPSNPARLGLLERPATMEAYIKPLLPVIATLEPESIGFFAGRLDLGALNTPERLLMRVLSALIGVPPGDYRNWEAIKSWVRSLDATGARPADVSAGS